MSKNSFSQLVCPFKPEDPAQEMQLRRQLLWVFFFRVVLLTFLLGILVFFRYQYSEGYQTVSLQRVGLFIGAIYLFTIGSALLIKLVPCTRPFTYIQISLDVLLTSILVFSAAAAILSHHHLLLPDYQRRHPAAAARGPFHGGPVIVTLRWCPLAGMLRHHGPLLPGQQSRSDHAGPAHFCHCRPPFSHRLSAPLWPSA